MVSLSQVIHTAVCRVKRSGEPVPDIYAIRKRNLVHLRGDEHGGAKRLAEQIGMGESQMSRLLKGKQMGSDLARQIEEALKLPRGWLDTEYHDLTTDSIDVARQFQDLKPEAQTTFRDLLKQLKK